jgi:hypothetical protein
LAAVGRKLAVILHRMWIDGTEFKWSSKGREPWTQQGSSDESLTPDPELENSLGG